MMSARSAFASGGKTGAEDADDGVMWVLLAGGPSFVAVIVGVNAGRPWGDPERPRRSVRLWP
jgi:hypothetical protein